MDIYNTEFQRSERARLHAALERLRRDVGLGEALEGLRRHQVRSGFIQDDLSEVQRFEFERRDGSGDYLAAQYNPARARRFAGSGLREPPPGFRAVNGGCFLCAENVEWQQRGAEVGYPVDGGHVAYTAWMNPFPLAVGHAVIASDDHIPQHWSNSGIGLGQLVCDLIDFSDRLPGWITFYNGVGAGASIESHLHFHALPRTRGLHAMPIEQAADRHRVELDRAATLNGAIARGLYPLDFAHWRGRHDEIVQPVLSWLDAWQHQRGGDADATANAMAVRHADGPEMDVFFVPRVRSRSRAEGFGGVIGAFETMGEIICSHPEERRLMASGAIDYDAIADLLRHVSVAL